MPVSSCCRLPFLTFLLLAACGSGYVPTTATVETIDRQCTIVTSKRTEVPTGVEGETRTREVETGSHKGDCKSVEEWSEVRSSRKRDIDGEAEVHVVYTSPIDGKQQRGTLHFDGRDDQFYSLRSGDTVKITVSKSDPTKIFAAR